MALRQLAQRLAVLPSQLGPSVSGVDVLAGSWAAEGVRHASSQAVKQRIRAIKNIAKITKAMKMVAASKMRNAQVAVESSRGMVSPFTRLLGDYPAIDPAKVTTVAVTSDRGLCGGLNSNITKYTRQLLALLKGEGGAPGESAQLVTTIGDKGRSQIARLMPDKLASSFAETYKVKVTFPQASMIAEDVLSHGPEAVRVLFNKFHNAASFKPTVATVLLPAALDKQLMGEQGSKLDIYEMEVAGERADALQDLAELQLATVLFNAMLENNCSEHASRMSAMENSTKSASEMLGALWLKYNRDRQSSITNELIEIISGAAALEDAS